MGTARDAEEVKASPDRTLNNRAMYEAVATVSFHPNFSTIGAKFEQKNDKQWTGAPKKDSNDNLFYEALYMREMGRDD